MIAIISNIPDRPNDEGASLNSGTAGSDGLSTERGRYVARNLLPERRPTWRQRASIVNKDDGVEHTFYIDFGEYPDGTLGEVFITSAKTGSFVRGTLDALARSISLAIQSGTAPHELARTLCGMDYPPSGEVRAEGSAVTECSSIADYIGQEILSCYGEDGKRK